MLERLGSGLEDERRNGHGGFTDRCDLPVRTDKKVEEIYILRVTTFVCVSYKLEGIFSYFDFKKK